MRSLQQIYGLPIRLLTLLVAAASLSSSAFGALTINPTFIDAVGETWTADRQGVVNQAISDWESVIGGVDDGFGGTNNISIDVDFSFANAGASYLGTLLRLPDMKSATCLGFRPCTSTISILRVSRILGQIRSSTIFLIHLG